MVEGRRSVHRVHEHPSYERGRGAFVKAGGAFFANSLEKAIDWAAELGI